MEQQSHETRNPHGGRAVAAPSAEGSTSAVSPQALRTARMRLFVKPHLRYALSAHIFTFIGAVAISTTVYLTSSVSIEQAMLWPAVIALTNALTIIFNVSSSRREIPDTELERAANIKTFCNILQGLAWGFGPQILNVPGEAVTVIAPAWAMVTGVGVLVFAAAPWPPSSYSFITALFLPAVIFLLTHESPLERTVGIAMIVSFPFSLLIGRLGVQYVGDLVAARLAVSQLLERESHLTERLKHMNNDRTRFFSSASHDLRQPLQALGFYMTILSNSGSNAVQREIINRLAECSDQLDRQFNAILGVASTDQAIVTAVTKSVRLQSALVRVHNAVRPQALKKGLDLRLVATSLIANVSPDVLERVLVNLVSNAVRYTETGRILMGARRRGDRIEICVADTGIGISDTEIGRIFGDFYQIANIERHADKGFGLGLGIVKRLCDGMDWEIRVSSQPGVGSIFSVLVPAGTGEYGEAAAETDHPSPPFDLTHLGVVIVDDDPLVVDATSRLLRTWGVDHFSSIREEDIVFHLDRRDPSKSWLVLLDYRLGEHATGIDFADRIRARFGTDIHLIIVTGEQDSGVADAAADRGISLLRKPLKPIQLRAALMNVAGSHV